MPAVLRSLLPIIAVLALLVQPVTTWASSGIVGDTRCCCPDPETCDCHDHKGAPHHDAKMKRCGSDPVEIVTPILLTATPAAAPPWFVPRRPILAPPYVVTDLPEGRSDRPEKPPS